MLFRMLYDDKLAQASYLIGCQRTGEAVIIDPARDIDRYQTAAKREGLRIVAAADTHIHADYLSGLREFGEQGVKLYVSGHGGPDWSYGWLDKKSGGGWYDHKELHDGQTFKIGNIEIKAIHTPGHTPEHICFLVTDLGGGASEPMGIATGDFIFVGDVGRPDLLESAAGQAGAAATSARELFHSVAKFMALPDYLQVWPSHGAGSACGKALGAVPQSTVGYEKRFSAALKAARDEPSFTTYVLSNQPDPPSYFARMKRDNRDGPAILGTLPGPTRFDAAGLKGIDTRKVAIADTRPWEQFAGGHLAGSLSLLLTNQFPTEAGSLIDPAEDVVLIIDQARLDDAIRDLVHVGIDHVIGWAPPEAVVEAAALGASFATIAEVDAKEAMKMVAEGRVFVLDVRKMDEHAAGHIAGSMNVSHTRVNTAVDEIPNDREILVHCRGGVRSARACAYLQREGRRVTNMLGGFMAWEKAGGPVQT